MLAWLKKIWPFGKRPDFDAERWEEHAEAKEAGLERILGPMDDTVGHALIPFCVGGAVDMYYFSSCIPGTVFVTMELINPDGEGPKPNQMGTYEVITCTRLRRPPIESHEATRQRIKDGNLSDWDKIERRMCGIMTVLGNYCFETVIEPGETAELPEKDDVNYVIFDKFDTKGVPLTVEGKNHGLLLCIEVHRSELEYARQFGSGTVLAKLREAGHYPYSDLDREPVV